MNSSYWLGRRTAVIFVCVLCKTALTQPATDWLTIIVAPRWMQHD